MSNKQLAEGEKERGNRFYKRRQFQQALECYDKAWELDSTNITILTNKAAVLFEQEKYQECIDICEKAVEVGRDLRLDYKLIARAYGRIGNANLKLDNLEEAIKYYNKSLTEHRTPEILQKLRDSEKLKAQREKEAYYDPKLADVARNAGNELYKKNDFAGAVQQYTEAIKRNDKDPRSYSNRAACYLKLMALNEALKDAEKCIELDPTFVRGYTRKAAIEFARKEYSKCLETCLEAKEKDVANRHAAEIQQQMIKCSQAMSTSNESQEDVLKRAAQDPEIQRILGDPVMQQILTQMQQDPKAAQEHLKNPKIAASIRKLIAAGILKVA